MRIRTDTHVERLMGNPPTHVIVPLSASLRQSEWFYGSVKGRNPCQPLRLYEIQSVLICQRASVRQSFS